MHDMLIYLKETLDEQDAVMVHLNTGTARWIRKIEEIYDDKWIRVLDVNDTDYYLINMDYVVQVEL